MNSKRLPPTDAMFLYLESPETKMHVAGLKYFTPPPDAGDDYVRSLHEEMRSANVEAPWNRRLATPRFLRSPVHAWVQDEQFDIDYHVRRSALASPGDERELGVLVSRLHSNAIDFARPPWELHLIEGLAGGRFAVYVKIHHSLIDGYTGVQLLQRSLSTTADDRTAPFFFSKGPRRRSEHVASGSSAGASAVKAAAAPLKAAVGAVRATTAVTRAAASLQLSQFSSQSDLVSALSAPPSLLNQRTGRNRRFATAQLDLAQMRHVAAANDVTLNDVVMAVFGGGLRAYLEELDDLPDKSLIGFIPINIRVPGDSGGGTQVGATLATMGTDIDDPLARLTAIAASTRQAKAQMAGMTQGAMLAYSGYLLAPAALQAMAAVLRLDRVAPATFNVCVSNLPGPQEVLYLRGARLDAYYPVSIPMHGMALNITCLSYDGQMNVGFVGCRDALPHLQRLAVHTIAAFEQLRQAAEERS